MSEQLIQRETIAGKERRERGKMEIMKTRAINGTKSFKIALRRV